MPSLNLDLRYFENPKVKRLTAGLGKGAPLLPLRLWCHAAAFHPEDGIFIGYSDKEMEAIMGWDGQQGLALGHLCRLGFLDVLENGFQVHDWKEHAGHISLYKLKSAAMVAARRKKKLERAQEMMRKALEKSPFDTLFDAKSNMKLIQGNATLVKEDEGREEQHSTPHGSDPEGLEYEEVDSASEPNANDEDGLTEDGDD